MSMGHVTVNQNEFRGSCLQREQGKYRHETHDQSESIGGRVIAGAVTNLIALSISTLTSGGDSGCDTVRCGSG